MIDLDEFFVHTRAASSDSVFSDGNPCDVCGDPLPLEAPRPGPKRKRHCDCRNKRKRDRMAERRRGGG